MKIIQLSELSAAFRVTHSNAQMIFERCAANRTTDADLLYRAGCLDLSEFGENWDFSQSFRREAELVFNPVIRGASGVSFSLLKPSVQFGVRSLYHFPLSEHSPLKPNLSSLSVPRLFLGSKIEQSPYVRIINRLHRNGYSLVFQGYIDFKMYGPSHGQQTGTTGLITVSGYLPRIDYLAEYLKDFF